MKKPTQKNKQTSDPEKLSNPETSDPEKSSNPHEKTKPRNLKQFNTHREKKTQVRERVNRLVLFPTLLVAKRTQKIIISLNFVTLYQTRSVTHMPRPSDEALMWWRWSHAMEAMEVMHVSIYFKCYDVHNDMKRVPKEFMNLIRKDKVGFWVDRRKNVIFFGHGCLGLELSVFCHGSLSLEQRVWSEANQREKRRVRKFKGQREIFGLVAY